MFRKHLTRAFLASVGTLFIFGTPFSNADAHHRGGFGRSFGRGIGMGLGGGIGYGVARYGMHRVFGGFHHPYASYGYAPPPPPYYGGGYYGVAPAYGPPNVTIINAPPPPPPPPPVLPNAVPNYPYPVPGYTHYQPGNGYTTEPRVTYVPGYGNVPVSSPITP